MNFWRLVTLSLSLAAGVSCKSTTYEAADREGRLESASTWMYQLARLDDSAALAELADSPYPMLVIEPGHNFRPCDGFDPADYGIDPASEDSACADVYDTEAIIDELREAPDGTDRLLIAYIDIGQAEFYRDYWSEGWAAPTADEPGSPEFILAADPDGWVGNYVVEYWDDEWKDLWVGRKGIVGELAEMGFDGVYLDWVEAYDDDRIYEAAEARDLDSAEEMVLFMEEIRERGRDVTPDFLVIAQNAPYLLDDAPSTRRFVNAIDALAVEDTWFYGNGSTEDWNAGEDDLADRLSCEVTHCDTEISSPDNVCANDEATQTCAETIPVSGDLHGGSRHQCADGTAGTSQCWSSENRVATYARYQAEGVPVFSVDYCVSDDAAREAYTNAREAGLRPLVTRVQLSRMTETPPWSF